MFSDSGPSRGGSEDTEGIRGRRVQRVLAIQADRQVTQVLLATLAQQVRADRRVRRRTREPPVRRERWAATVLRVSLESKALPGLPGLRGQRAALDRKVSPDSAQTPARPV